MNDRIFSPSPTVRASRVPLYQQGLRDRLSGLGDDPTMYDPGNTLIDPSFADPYANYVIPINLTAPANIDTTMIDASSVLTPPAGYNAPIVRPLQLQPGATSNKPSWASSGASVGSSIASLFSPSPRVSSTPTRTAAGTAPPGSTLAAASSFLDQQTIPGVANKFLIVGVGIAFLAMMGGRR